MPELPDETRFTVTRTVYTDPVGALTADVEFTAHINTDVVQVDLTEEQVELLLRPVWGRLDDGVLVGADNTPGVDLLSTDDLAVEGGFSYTATFHNVAIDGVRLRSGLKPVRFDALASGGTFDLMDAATVPAVGSGAATARGPRGWPVDDAQPTGDGEVQFYVQGVEVGDPVPLPTGSAANWSTLAGKPAVIAAGADAAAARTAIGAATAADITAAIAAVTTGLDEILEYANSAAFPATGAADNIYVALDTNLLYRWSGSAYVNVGGTPVTWSTLSGKPAVIAAGADAAAARTAIDAVAAATLTEVVQDILSSTIVEGANVTVTYNDAAGTLTIAAAGGGGGEGLDAEAVRDTIAAALIEGGLIDITVDDPGNTITISTTATANSPDATLLARANHTGTQAQSTITDLTTDLAAKAPTSRTISAGTGLTGGGSLAADRTLAADFGTGAGKVTEGNDSRLSDARTPTDGSVTTTKIAAATLVTATETIGSNNNDTTIPTSAAVKAFVDVAVAALIGGAPGALDTLDELAAALADDASFAASVTTALGGKQPLDADLTAIAALATTSFGRGMLTLADAAATRTALGLVIGTNVAAQGDARFTDTRTPTDATVTAAKFAASAIVTAAEGVASSDNDTSFPTTAAVIDAIAAVAPETRTTTAVSNQTSYTIDADATDVAINTGLTGAVTLNNPTGTPSANQMLAVTLQGTASRAITHGTAFEASGAVALPTTTSGTAPLDILYRWNSLSSKWRCVAVA